MIPLRRFIVEGCILDFHQAGLSPASDETAATRSCEACTLTRDVGSGLESIKFYDPHSMPVFSG